MPISPMVGAKAEQVGPSTAGSSSRDHDQFEQMLQIQLNPIQQSINTVSTRMNQVEATVELHTKALQKDVNDMKKRIQALEHRPLPTELQNVLNDMKGRIQTLESKCATATANYSRIERAIEEVEKKLENITAESGETNCGSKNLDQCQQHIGGAVGEDSGHGETSLDQHLLETEVEIAEAWAVYLAECFDSERLIQHAGAYSFAGDCSGADAPWQVIRQLQKALEKKGLQWKLSCTQLLPREEGPPTHAEDTARIFLALNAAPPIMFDDMTVCGGPCRYAKGLLRTLSWYLYVAGWVCQDVCSANTVAPKLLQAEFIDNRGKSAATTEGACRNPRHEEPMSGEWGDESADLVAGESDHNDAQGRKPKRDGSVAREECVTESRSQTTMKFKCQNFDRCRREAKSRRAKFCLVCFKENAVVKGRAGAWILKGTPGNTGNAKGNTGNVGNRITGWKKQTVGQRSGLKRCAKLAECADPPRLRRLWWWRASRWRGEWDHNDGQGRKPKRIKLIKRSRIRYLMAKAHGQVSCKPDLPFLAKNKNTTNL